ncbi:MAG: MlaD family protein [Mycobacterium sp.]
MLTTFVRRQLILLGIIAVAALSTLGWYYLRIPALVGIGQYQLKAELPASGGLYRTANVTYHGVTIGQVIALVPNRHGALATLRIDSHYKIPIDAAANVHSVSAVGEQYLDLVSAGNPRQYFSPGQTITKGTVPAEIGPMLDAANRGLAALPRDKLATLLDESAQAVGGLGPTLQLLVDSTQAIAGDFKTNIADIHDIISNALPILDSQANTGTAIERWARNFNTLAGQSAGKDEQLKSLLRQSAPTATEITAVFQDLGEALPQLLANLAIVSDMAKRYNKNLEQSMALLPEIVTILETITSSWSDRAGLNVPGGFFTPTPPCLTGYVPASQWRAQADTSPAEVPEVYCKIPQDMQNAVRGARNIPCVDVPGKRAATPRECRSDKPYIPLGTNPWYGEPNQIRNCPAYGARCDQPVEPGHVIPAPSIDTGMVPLPADKLPGTPPPASDPPQRPGSGSVQCNGQQPNPCIYTPSGPATASYDARNDEVVNPDGVRFSVENSNHTGDDGWKNMLAPAN